MPNRILKESICTSETIDGLSADAERFFYRLLVQCDDYGRMDGRASVLRARCFPLRLDTVTDKDIKAWLDELIAVDLLWLYQAEGKTCLQVTTWAKHQQTRAKNSKYPNPPAREMAQSVVIADDSTYKQVPAIVSENREYENTRIENREDPRAAEKKSAGAESPKHPAQEMWDALVQVCHVKLIQDATADKPIRGQLNRLIKRLQGMGLSPPDIHGYAKWYEDAWRQGHAPLNLQRFQGDLGAWLDAGKPASRATQNGSKPNEQRTYDHEVMDKTKFRAALSEVQGRGVPVQPVRAGDDVENGVDTLPGVRAGPSG